jgi:hypothetical protein
MTFRFEDTKPAPENTELLADLRSVAAKLGRNHLAQNDYRRFGRYSSTVMKKRFGSWNNALVAADLKTVSRPRASKNELVANLLNVWMVLGRQPRRSEMRPPLSRCTHHPYIRTYGSWLAAMKTFVEYANAEAPEGALTDPAPSDVRGPRAPSVRLRFRVMLRDGFRCRHCGRSPALEPGVVLNIDHFVAWADGGATTLENLQTLCERCNLGKSDEPISATGA